MSQLGSFGTGIGQFSNPQGVFYETRTAKLYVADTGNHRIQRFLADGTIDSSWGIDGVVGVTASVRRDHTGFDRPTAVAVNPITQEIYIADYGNARIEVFNASGTYLRTYLGHYRVNGLAFDDGGNLYIVGEDPSESFTQYDGRLRLLRAGEAFVAANYTGGLDDLGRRLEGVAIRDDGGILITDTLNGRLVRTDSSFTEPVRDLAIDTNGSNVVLSWKTQTPSITKVDYGDSMHLGMSVVDMTLKTNHRIAIPNLTPNRRLFYTLSFKDTFDESERSTPVDVINTGVRPGFTQFQRLKGAGIIYTDTQAGTGFSSMTTDEIAEAANRFARVSDFYWRNSSFKLWLDIEIILVNRDITEQEFSVLNTMASDLAALGYGATDDFDALWELLSWQTATLEEEESSSVES